MKRTMIISMLAAAILSSTSCSKENEMQFAMNNGSFETSAIFNVSVSDNSVMTKGSDLINNSKLGLDDNVAFGLVGAGIENLGVYADNGVRSVEIINTNSSKILASAYYPYVSDVDTQEDGTSIITFTQVDFQKGPMASNNVEINLVQEANVVNLQFHSIADNVSFAINDITEDDQLVNLIHIRQICLYGAATQGVYVKSENPYWIPQYSRLPYMVFDGETKLDKSAGMISDSFFVVPESMDGKYVEVVFDVDEFDYNGTHYNASTELSLRINLDGVQPDNNNIYTLGLDLAEIYQTIEFGASVAEWENETVIE